MYKPGKGGEIVTPQFSGEEEGKDIGTANFQE